MKGNRRERAAKCADKISCTDCPAWDGKKCTGNLLMVKVCYHSFIKGYMKGAEREIKLLNENQPKDIMPGGWNA